MAHKVSLFSLALASLLLLATSIESTPIACSEYDRLTLDVTYRDIKTGNPPFTGIENHHYDFELPYPEGYSAQGFCPEISIFDHFPGCYDDTCQEDGCRYHSIDGHILGMVRPELDDDRKPIYHLPAGKKSIMSATTFHSWFHDAEDAEDSRLRNMKVEKQLVLSRKGRLSNLFEYDSSKCVEENCGFFPLDGLGFNDVGLQGHNFGFTTEIHTSFIFRGGETFTFAGDDDFWLFINGKLVIDLGGLHVALCRTIILSADEEIIPSGGEVYNGNCIEDEFFVEELVEPLHLIPGNEYSLDIFHAERHSPDSFFRITTSLDLQTAPPSTFFASVTTDVTTLTIPYATSTSFVVSLSVHPDEDTTITCEAEDGAFSFSTPVFLQCAEVLEQVVSVAFVKSSPFGSTVICTAHSDNDGNYYNVVSSPMTFYSDVGIYWESRHIENDAVPKSEPMPNFINFFNSLPTTFDEFCSKKIDSASQLQNNFQCGGTWNGVATRITVYFFEPEDDVAWTFRFFLDLTWGGLVLVDDKFVTSSTDDIFYPHDINAHVLDFEMSLSRGPHKLVLYGLESQQGILDQRIEFSRHNSDQKVLTNDDLSAIITSFTTTTSSQSTTTTTEASTTDTTESTTENTTTQETTSTESTTTTDSTTTTETTTTSTTTSTTTTDSDTSTTTDSSSTDDGTTTIETETETETEATGTASDGNPPASGAGSSSLSSGAIAGIVIGVILLAALVATALFIIKNGKGKGGSRNSNDKVLLNPMYEEQL